MQGNIISKLYFSVFLLITLITIKVKYVTTSNDFIARKYKSNYSLTDNLNNDMIECGKRKLDSNKNIFSVEEAQTLFFYAIGYDLFKNSIVNMLISVQCGYVHCYLIMMR